MRGVSKGMRRVVAGPVAASHAPGHKAWRSDLTAQQPRIQHDSRRRRSAREHGIRTAGSHSCIRRVCDGVATPTQALLLLLFLSPGCLPARLTTNLAQEGAKVVPVPGASPASTLGEGESHERASCCVQARRSAVRGRAGLTHAHVSSTAEILAPVEIRSLPGLPLLRQDRRAIAAASGLPGAATAVNLAVFDGDDAPLHVGQLCEGVNAQVCGRVGGQRMGAAEGSDHRRPRFGRGEASTASKQAVRVHGMEAHPCVACRRSTSACWSRRCLDSSCGSRPRQVTLVAGQMAGHARPPALPLGSALTRDRYPWFSPQHWHPGPCIRRYGSGAVRSCGGKRGPTPQQKKRTLRFVQAAAAAATAGAAM